MSWRWGDNPRFVVTSLDLPDPQTVYTKLYCALGQTENFIKHLKCDLASDRTSCTTFLANCMRLALHAAAYVLHQRLRTQALKHTELANAQPKSIILKLFKIAVQVKPYKNRVILHPPSTYPYRHLLWQLTERLYLSRPARINSSCHRYVPPAENRSPTLNPPLLTQKFPQINGGWGSRA